MDIRALVSPKRSQLAYSARSVIAAVAAFALAQVLELPLPIWAVLTAIIVTLTSDGRLLGAAIDYFAGTIGGAIYGGAVGALVPHSTEIAMFATLILALTPLVFIASTASSMVIAPVTGVIVLLMPSITHASPITSALDRVLEVALGAFTGLFVSFIVLPSTVHHLFAEAAARALDELASASEILLGQTRRLDQDTLDRLQRTLLQAVTRLSTINDEAERERMAHLARKVETGSLFRAIVRLRHDLVMIASVAYEPLPADVQVPLAQVREAFADYLRLCANALLRSRESPSLGPIVSALHAYEEQVAEVRRKGLTPNLAGNIIEHFFVLAFTFEQMRHDVEDLARSVTGYRTGLSVGAWFRRSRGSPTSLDDETHV